MQSLGTTNNILIGWYFSLPHLVYLVVIAMNNDWQKKYSAKSLCSAGLIALLIASIGQYQATNETFVVLWRLLMGVGVCLTFIGLHQSIAILKAESVTPLVS